MRCGDATSVIAMSRRVSASAARSSRTSCKVALALVSKVAGRIREFLIEGASTVGTAA